MAFEEGEEPKNPNILEVGRAIVIFDEVTFLKVVFLLTSVTLPNLQTFFICDDEFSGIIPFSLSNATRLQLFEVVGNNHFFFFFFFWQFLTILGNIPDLWWLGFDDNSYSANSLDFMIHL